MSPLLAAMLVGASALGQPLPVMLRLDSCQLEPLDVGELASLLQVELPSIVSRPVRVWQSPLPLPMDPAALQIDIRCQQDGGSPALAIEFQPPVAHVETLVPLRDVLPAERTRTMAMAIAEFLRPLREPLPAQPLYSAPPADAVALPGARVPSQRPRLPRSTIALLSVGGVFLTTGLVLGSLTWSNLVHGQGGDIVGGIGYGALGVSALSLATMGITLGRSRQ